VTWTEGQLRPTLSPVVKGSSGGGLPGVLRNLVSQDARFWAAFFQSFWRSPPPCCQSGFRWSHLCFEIFHTCGTQNAI